MRSTDGGATWQWMDQAPWLLMAAFGDGDTVVGLTPYGQVHTSADAGQTWRATSLLAPDAQALHASGEGQKPGDPHRHGPDRPCLHRRPAVPTLALDLATATGHHQPVPCPATWSGGAARA